MSLPVETPPSPITPVTPNPPLSTIPESLTTAPTPGISQPPPTASDDVGITSSPRASETSSQPAADVPITFKKENTMPWKDAGFAQKYKTAEIVTGHFARKLIEQTGILATAAANPSDSEKVSSPAAREATGLTPLRILDNACGTGVVSKILYEGLDEERKKGLEVVCGDFSESMVEFVFKRINEEGWEGARGAVVDAQETGLPDNHFTHIITNFAIMGMPDGIGALKECHRILQPTGQLAFTTWSHAGWLPDVRAAIATLPGPPPFPSDTAMIKSWGVGDWHLPQWVAATVSAVGFEDVRVELVEDEIESGTVDEFTETFGIMMPGIMSKFWSERERIEVGDMVKPAMRRQLAGRFGEGGMVRQMWRAVVVTGRKPGERGEKGEEKVG